MPSHDLATTELRAVAQDAFANAETVSLLNHWKKILHFDFKMEFGKHLKKVTTKQKLSAADKIKNDIFCKAALAINSLDGREVRGRTSNAVQVNVVTVDPTK